MSAPTAGAKPFPALWLAALRAIEADDWNPMGRANSGVEVISELGSRSGPMPKSTSPAKP